MVARDENGRFQKGNEGGPGRPKKEREQAYYDVLVSTVTLADWKAIVEKAVTDAKRGDATARKFLADYLIGPPVETRKLTGADDGPVTVALVEIVKDYGGEK